MSIWQPDIEVWPPDIDVCGSGSLLRAGALRGAGEAGLVAVGRVLLDQTALGGLVDRGEARRERVLVGVAAGDARAALLQRRAEGRLPGAVPRLSLFGLTSLLLGRANVRHVCNSLWLLGYWVA